MLVRLIGQSLSERLGQPVVIDNQRGTATSIGTEPIISAPPDGHTLVLVIAANVIRARLDEKLNFDFVREIAPVAGISRNSICHGCESIGSDQDRSRVHAYANGNPGKVHMASSGYGGILHLAGELFKTMTNVNMVHVPYQGAAPAITNLLSEQVQVIFTPVPTVIQHIKAGKLRALAVTAAMRSETLPDVPTVRRLCSGYEASGFQGLCAPRTHQTK